MTIPPFARVTALLVSLATALMIGTAAGAADPNPCNPCAAKKSNPCNPCAKKPANPCGAKGMNPCGASGRVDPARFKRPAGLRMEGDHAQLAAEGEKLWSRSSLSTNGAACATCHTDYAAFLPSFAERYPHSVAMVKNLSGVDRVDSAEMVQFCMIQPMQAEPLAWNSRELAALTPYVEHIQAGFEPKP